MGEDTEFVSRFRSEERPIVYVPGTAVTHCLAEKQVELMSLFERAFFFGRTHITLSPEAPVIRKNPLESRLLKAEEERQFMRGIMINFYCGELNQLCKANLLPDRRLLDALRGLEIQLARGLLSPVCLQFLSSEPELCRLIG